LVGRGQFWIGGDCAIKDCSRLFEFALLKKQYSLGEGYSSQRTLGCRKVRGGCGGGRGHIRTYGHYSGVATVWVSPFGPAGTVAVGRVVGAAEGGMLLASSAFVATATRFSSWKRLLSGAIDKAWS
jgi:hypothetical protein